jgi:hypothetical protein
MIKVILLEFHNSLWWKGNVLILMSSRQVLFPPDLNDKWERGMEMRPEINNSLAMEKGHL